MYNILTTENPTIATNENENNTVIFENTPPVVEQNTNTVPIVENTTIVAPIIEDVQKIPAPVLKPTKEKKIQKKVPTRSRISLTANFTPQEYEDVKKVIEWRISNGSTTTYDHFVRQCIDFALCHGTQLQSYLTGLPKENIGLFAIPTDVEILPLTKKGFFKK